MRYLFFLLWMIGLLLGCGDGGGKNPVEVVGGEGDSSDVAMVAFADSSLEGAVRAALGKSEGDLVEADLLALTQLDAGGLGISDIAGIEQLKGLQILTLKDNAIVDISLLAELDQLRLLDLDNNQVVDISSLAGLTQLEGVVLDNNRIEDISVLLGLENLQVAEMRGNPLDEGTSTALLEELEARGVQVGSGEDSDDSLTPIEETLPESPVAFFLDPDLERAVRSTLQNFGELSERELLRIEKLELTGIGVRDLNGIERLGNLIELNLDNYEFYSIVNGEWFSYVKPNTMLNEVADLSPLAALTRLEKLGLALNPIEDLAPLAGLASLTQLRLASDLLRDLSPLAGMVNMSELNIDFCPIDDIGPLSGMSKMKRLAIIQSEVEDLSPLAGMRELTVLAIMDSKVRDLSPLVEMQKLTNLYITGNEVADLSPLASLTGLLRVNLSNNRIEDLSPLLGTQAISITLKGNPLSEESLNVHAPALRKRGIGVYVE